MTAPETAARLDPQRMAALAAVAGHLIPAAHGMPSAGDVVSEARLRFVLDARPDLLEPLQAALRPELGDDVAARLATLERASRPISPRSSWSSSGAITPTGRCAT